MSYVDFHEVLKKVKLLQIIDEIWFVIQFFVYSQMS
jgi:hypothetical protein